ncbi:MAG: aldo/keto reductase [Candidatus Odinarchaeia archaeon]
MVSEIGFGGIPIQRVSFNEAVNIVRKALDLGITFIDTARVYTDSEQKIGAAIKGRRAQCILASKAKSLTKQDMEKELHESLKTLNVKKIDLYQIHNVSGKENYEKAISADGALTALKEAKETGLIDHIGITSHIRDILKEAIPSGLFDTVQFPLNPLETENLDLIELAKQHDVGVIIMKPLAGGAFRNSKPAIKWILQHDVSVVIPGMDSITQVEENTSLSKQTLTDQELKSLEKEVATIDKEICRRCEYCQPCPQGINIPVILLIDGYYQRYGLTDWAKERYPQLVEITPEACIDCGECEEKCPYNLPIRKLIKEAHKRLTS